MQSRRHFLKYTTASFLMFAGGSVAQHLAGLGQAVAQDTVPAGREFLMLCDTHVTVPQASKATRPGTLNAFNVGTGEISSISLPFFGHIVNQHPLYPHQVVTFEKWGVHAALVDIEAKKILTIIEPEKGHQYFGHSVFNGDASILVDTEQGYEQSTGKLVLRSLSDMKIVQTLSTYGGRPHECRSYDHGRTIMVVNAENDSSPTCLSWVDLKSGALVRKIEFSVPHVQFGHFDISFDGWICVSGLGKGGHNKKHYELITFISPDGRVCAPLHSDKMLPDVNGEALSIAFLGQSGLVAVTLPDVNLVLVIDYKTQNVVEALTLPKPKGVLPRLDAHDNQYGMFVSLKDDRTLVDIKVHTDGQAPTIGPSEYLFGGSGSHMTRMYL